jgi:hypothetical protein
MGPRPRAECAATPRLPGCDRTATGYRGQDADEDYRDPSPAVAQLRDALTPPGGTTNLRFSYQDGHVAVRLNDASPAKEVRGRSSGAPDAWRDRELPHAST